METKPMQHHMTRRQFLASVGNASLIVGFSFTPLGSLMSNDAHAATSELAVDSWIVLDNKAIVTIYSGKVELGTGVQTALMQIVAEELFVGLDRVEFVQGDTSLTPGDQGFTAGSKTIQNEGPPLRRRPHGARADLHGEGVEMAERILLGELTLRVEMLRERCKEHGK